MKHTFGHFEQPLPLSLDLGIPPLHLHRALLRRCYDDPSTRLAHTLVRMKPVRDSSPLPDTQHNQTLLQRAHELDDALHAREVVSILR